MLVAAVLVAAVLGAVDPMGSGRHSAARADVASRSKAAAHPCHGASIAECERRRRIMMVADTIRNAWEITSG